jgi:hypothetical protein
MKKIILSTLFIYSLFELVWPASAHAFGSSPPTAAKPTASNVVVASKPMPAPSKPAAALVIAAKPVVMPTPALAVAAKTVVKQARLPVINVPTKPKPQKRAKSAAEIESARLQKVREDDVIAFSNSNQSCDSTYAWSRIKESGYTNTSAPKRVKIAVEKSVNPSMDVCKKTVAQKKPVADIAKPAVAEQTTVGQKVDSTVKTASSLFDKFKASVKQGQVEKTCEGAQKAMGQCS